MNDFVTREQTRPQDALHRQCGRDRARMSGRANQTISAAGAARSAPRIIIRKCRCGLAIEPGTVGTMRAADASPRSRSKVTRPAFIEIVSAFGIPTEPAKEIRITHSGLRRTGRHAVARQELQCAEIVVLVPFNDTRG